MAFVRALGDPGDVTLPLDDEPVGSCEALSDGVGYEVVNTLVRVSQGRDGTGGNAYGFYPFGKQASVSTKEFKALPDAWFAIALAELYPFISREQQKWKGLMENFAHVCATVLCVVCVTALTDVGC